MTEMKQKLVVAVTGASGAIYAKVLLDRLKSMAESLEEVGVIFSDNARDVWTYELGNEAYKEYPFKIYEKNNFFSPVASGSAGFTSMIIAPCSMGTLARIAGGISNDLITRAADVMLKERRKLILVLRESPYNGIHLTNMKVISDAGGIICPASPSFYSKPSDFEELALTVIDRALKLAGFETRGYRWGSEQG